MSSSGIDYRYVQPNTVPQFINKQVIPATTNQNASFMFSIQSGYPLGWIDPSGNTNFYPLASAAIPYNLLDVSNNANMPYTTSVDISNSVYVDVSGTTINTFTIQGTNMTTYAASYSVGYYSPQTQWNTPTVATTANCNGIVKTHNGNSLNITLDIANIEQLTPSGWFHQLPFCLLWAPVTDVITTTTTNSKGKKTTTTTLAATTAQLVLNITKGSQTLFNKTLTLPMSNTKISNGVNAISSSYNPHRIMIDVYGNVWVKTMGSGNPNGGIADFLCSSGYEEKVNTMSLSDWNNTNTTSINNVMIPRATPTNNVYSYPANTSANSILSPFVSTTATGSPSTITVTNTTLTIDGTTENTYNNQMFVLGSPNNPTGILYNNAPCYQNTVTINVDSSFVLPFVTMWGCNANCGFTQDASGNYFDLSGNMIEDSNGNVITANSSLHPVHVGTLPYGSKISSTVDMEYPTINTLNVNFVNNPEKNVTLFPSVLISRTYNPYENTTQLTNIAPPGYRYMAMGTYANRIVIDANYNVWVKSVQFTNPAAGLAGIASWVALCP